VAAMTEEHKQALAEGRRQSRAVRNYLEALESESQSSGLDEETIQQRIEEIQSKIDAEDNHARRVELIQQRLDYEEQLSQVEEGLDIQELEREFVDVVEAYSERKGLSYKAWREAGVPASVLRDAGLSRGFRGSGS
jgi:hypothetical protein